MEHEMTVARLKELLSELKDDDVLIPNSVRNLAIYRGGDYVGFVDFLKDSSALEML